MLSDQWSGCEDFRLSSGATLSGLWAGDDSTNHLLLEGCDPVHGGPGLAHPRTLSPACLFQAHWQTLHECLTRGTPMPADLPPILAEAFPMEHLLAAGVQAFPGPLAAPVHPVMMRRGGWRGGSLLGPLSWSFKRHAAWTPQGTGGPCAIFGGFLGTVGGLGDGILSRVQWYLCFF